MTRNRFDQASRFAAKLDAPEFLHWLFGAHVAFRQWLDTRTLPFPGDPDRICDTVAYLDAGPDREPFAVAIEFCLEPDAAMFGRLLVYLGQLWLEVRPNGQQGRRYQIGAAVVNLTGQGRTSRAMQLPGVSFQTHLEVVERNLAHEEAAATLDGVAAGTVARCLLPWIPLMRGGDDPGIIQRWRQLALAEPDPHRRGSYGGLAIVFAEAADRKPLWDLELRDWNMKDSQTVLEWISEGQARALLRLLRKKFPPGPAADLVATIEASTDPEQLDRWLEAVLDANTLDEFRAAMNS